MILAVVDDATARQLSAAVSARLLALRRDGVSPPAGLLELARTLATRGHSRPKLDSALSDVDDQRMDVLALDYKDAGARLSTSDRTVRRLVRSGELPAVEIAGCKRIRTTDLEAFVAGLPAADPGDTKTAAGEAERPG